MKAVKWLPNSYMKTKGVFRIPYQGKFNWGKEKIFVEKSYSSPGNYFVTFPRQKFSPTIFESNHFLTVLLLLTS